MKKPAFAVQETPAYCLTFLSGNQKDKQYTLVKPEVTIGRSHENDIIITGDPKVSRKHAQLSFTLSGLKLSNISGKNVVFVNNHLIESVLILDSDIIKIGDTEVRVQFSHAAETSEGAQSVIQSSGNDEKTQINQSGVSSLANKTAKDETNKAIVVNLPDNKNSHLAKLAKVAALPQPVNNFAAAPISTTSTAKSTASNKEALTQRKRKLFKHKNKNLFANRFLFYLVFIGLFFYILLENVPTDKKEPANLRTAEQIAQDTQQTLKTTETLLQQEHEKEYNSTAQAYFIKGRRDYQVGQYPRALQAFEAALALQPNHNLARRYQVLAKRKIDELVQFNMIQGRRYRQKNQFRLCISALNNVLNIKKDPTDIVFKEAYALRQECAALQQGRY